MGYRYRKSFKVGGARINLSKSGIGASIGTKGFRVTKKAGGGTRTTASIPGTGISFVTDSKKGGAKKAARHNSAGTNLTGGSTGPQGPANDLLITTLLWIFVCLLTMFAIAVVGLVIYGDDSPGALFVLVFLIVPVVAATKVVQKLKAKGAQPEQTPPADDRPASIDAAAKAAPEPEEMILDDHVVRTYHVAGTTYREGDILGLSRENPDYEMSKRDLIDAGMTDEKIWEYVFDPGRVELVPEPDNPYDPNAVKVIVDGAHIGYIKRGSCKHVLNLIADNKILSIDCEMGGGKYKIVVEDYDDEKEKDVYRLEHDSTNFFAVLSISEKI